MASPNIKLVLLEDSEADLSIMRLFAKKAQLDFEAFLDAKKALFYIESLKGPFLLVTDVSMPELSGFQILNRLKEKLVNTNVIFVSGHTNIEYPIQALREGALDFLVKPLDFDAFEARVLKAFEHIKLSQELGTLQKQIFSGHSFESFVGQSQTIKDIFDLINKVSQFDSSVLITGESGVGKERVAKAIHQRGARVEKEFVAINCASLPENLIESELFGYVKGAFTGADKDTPGLFDIAHNGTIFLDEVGELPPALQAKLLRTLQEREIRPVGGKRFHKVDARLICATHKDLRSMVKNGQFREDLYYRINVIPIHIPPLRERREDIRVLVHHFINKLNERLGLEKSLDAGALEFLESQNYQGNVRELENMLERAYILSPSHLISAGDFENKILSSSTSKSESFFQFSGSIPSLKDVETAYIKEVISRTHTKDEAARLLGIGRKTLYRKELDFDGNSHRAPEARM